MDLLGLIRSKKGRTPIEQHVDEQHVNEPCSYEQRMVDIYGRCKDFTMIPQEAFIDNLRLVDSARHIPGCIVECGVWKGGMSAGMAMLLGPERQYYLFDSFEGLPPAKPIDGDAANRWQKDTHLPTYFDNCTASEDFAARAMKMAGADSFELVKGWFDKTLPARNLQEPIAILRLDGDWYDSTLVCLEYLFKKVTPGGMIILDDYYSWDGCSRALHDFLSRNSLTERIRNNVGGVCFLIKQEPVQ